MRINLYEELLKDDTDDLSTIAIPRILELFDKLLSEGDITDVELLGKVVKIRAKTQIEFNG